MARFGSHDLSSLTAHVSHTRTRAHSGSRRRGVARRNRQTRPRIGRTPRGRRSPRRTRAARDTLCGQPHRRPSLEKGRSQRSRNSAHSKVIRTPGILGPQCRIRSDPRLAASPPIASAPAGWDPTGLAKGWAVGTAADGLRALEQVTFSINAGGDVVCGLGKHSAELARPWNIGIEDPADRSRIT